MHLDLFGARILDTGTNYLQCFKNLQSLEICGGGLTDAGVKNIKDLASLNAIEPFTKLQPDKQILGTDFRSTAGTFGRSSCEPKYKIDLHTEDSPYYPDDDQESVVLPNKDGKNFLCFLPKVEKAKTGKPVTHQNTSSMIVETEKRVKLKTPDELLEVLKDRCFIRQEGWWSYEFCYQKQLRQLHLEEDKVVYDEEATAAFNQNLSDISTLKDLCSKDASQR